MSLKGKSAIVTGSTSGIGQAIAEAFAAEGCNVMLNGFGDRRRDRDAARATWPRNAASRSRINGADMSKPAEIADLVAKTKAALRRRRHPGQQRRHPARRADRELPAGEVGRHHRHQPQRHLPRHPCRAAGDEGRRTGAASSTSPARTAWSPRRTRWPTSRPSTASSASPRWSASNAPTPASPATRSAPAGC